MNEIMTTTGGELSVEQVENQVQKIQQLMKNVMKEGEHYGKIPGTEKNCLHKSGAEKLGLIFRLVPKFEITKTELPNLHREYEVICSLYTLSGVFVGQGVGCCSTMESKYRYRKAKNYEILDEPIPDDYQQQKEKYRKEGFGCKQIEGVWRWVEYESGEKQENPDIADTYNTVLKIAKKRSHVDATLSTTAASDIFTQDLDDDPEKDLDPDPDDKPPKNATGKTNKGSNSKGKKSGKKTEINDDAVLNELYQSNLSKEDKEKFKNGYLGTPSEHKATYYKDVITKQIEIAGKKPPINEKPTGNLYQQIEPEDTDFTFTDDTVPFGTEDESDPEKAEEEPGNKESGDEKEKIGQEVPAGLFGGQS